MLHGLLRRTLVGGSLLLLSLTSPLSAQRLVRLDHSDALPFRPQVQSSVLHQVRVDSAGVRPTHWQTGALIGGIAGLAVGALFVALDHAECESSPCHFHPVYILVPTSLFAVIGALVGSTVPRSR